MSDERTVCPRCGQTVPDMPFCIRCGESLHHHDPARAGSAGRRGSYAAAPAESVARVALFSTILPHLPRADLGAFRVAFAGGLVVLLALVAVGAFPAALVGAAVLVPLLMLLYVYSIDVYEGTPAAVIGLTLVWGIAWGAAFGLAIGAAAGRPGLPDRIGSGIVTLGVIVPLLGGAAMLAGPLILLRDRRYNDVLDGATFGVTSAVAFTGAQVIAGSLDLFAGGLTPVGEPLPWVGRILAIAVALPIVAAGAIGSAAGAFSLRYRAPIRDRDALGVAGRPAIAVVLAGGAAGRHGPCRLPARPDRGRRRPARARRGRAPVAAADAPRRAARGGVRDRDRPGDHLRELRAADAAAHVLRQLRDRPARAARAQGRRSAARRRRRLVRRIPGRRHRDGPIPAMSDHPFPTSGRPSWAPPGDEPARLRGPSLVAGFAVLLGVCLLVAALLAILAKAPEPPPDCQPGTECGGPPGGGVERVAGPARATTAVVPPGTIGIRAGTPWISRDLGYQFEYSDWWAARHVEQRLRRGRSRLPGLVG